LEEPDCESRRVGCTSRGDEGFKAECEACRPLPLLDGKVQQLKMEHEFMKAKLLIYQERKKRSQVE
jgi:hypothetical protein